MNCDVSTSNDNRKNKHSKLELCLFFVYLYRILKKISQKIVKREKKLINNKREPFTFLSHTLNGRQKKKNVYRLREC